MYNARHASSVLSIEVYLPKNLMNHGALVATLGEVLEFDTAKESLIANAGESFANVRLAELPGVVSILETEDEQKMDSLLRKSGRYPREGRVRYERVDREVHVVSGDGVEFILECDLSSDTLKWISSPSVWRDVSGSPSRRGMLPRIPSARTGEGRSTFLCGFRDVEEFKRRLRAMRPSVFGYSILEADGAFVGTSAKVGKDDLKAGSQKPIGASRTLADAKGLANVLGGEVSARRIGRLHKVLWRYGVVLGDLVELLHADDEDGIGEAAVEALCGYLEEKGWQRKSVVNLGSTLVLLEGEEWSVNSWSPALYVAYFRSGRLEVRRAAKCWRDEGQDSWVVSCGKVGIRVRYPRNVKAGRVGLEIQRTIGLVEERTSVIRFLIDLGIEAGHATDLVKGIVLERPSSGGSDEYFESAKRIAWDSIALVGQFFVHELCERVGREDEIWMTVCGEILLVWRKGILIQVGGDAGARGQGDRRMKKRGEEEGPVGERARRDALRPGRPSQ